MGKEDFTHRQSKTIRYSLEDSIFELHKFDISLEANEIYLMGNEEYVDPHRESNDEPGVEFSMANRFVRNIRLLATKSDKPILIHMKTCGGYWPEGMAIHNAIAACPNKVCILSYTHARSMSSLILQAADKRVLMPDSTFMFHDGEMWAGGTMKQVQTWVSEAARDGARMMEIYIDRLKEKGKFSKWSRDRIEKMLRAEMDRKEDVFLTSEEAVQWGFADEVFGGKNGVYDWDALLKFD